MKLSSPQQVNVVLTNLLQHAKFARSTPLPNSGNDQKQPLDEQSTYFFALIDCLPWIDNDQLEFWLNQVWQEVHNIQGQRREAIIRRLWECVSGEMGGDAGMTAVEWWLHRPQPSVL